MYCLLISEIDTYQKLTHIYVAKQELHKAAMLACACSQNANLLFALLQVACTDKNFRQNPQRTQPQPDLLADMAHSQFCLVMPGNVQSSGHLADAFFTGCIPVFLGPPFPHPAHPSLGERQNGRCSFQ